jgi:hypothetical protein
MVLLCPTVVDVLLVGFATPCIRRSFHVQHFAGTIIGAVYCENETPPTYEYKYLVSSRTGLLGPT